MTNQFLRVVKVGGSLFDLPDLATRLQYWLNVQPTARNILVPGGGKLVDELHLDAVRDSLSEKESHWEAIRRMSLNAKWMSKHLLGFECDSSLMYLTWAIGWANSSPIVFSPEVWLRDQEPVTVGTPLPESWDVTSDSIAARLAICTGADELVLLKSADPPSRDLQELADIGYVDKFLPKLAGELPPWRCVNLRRPDITADR